MQMDISECPNLGEKSFPRSRTCVVKKDPGRTAIRTISLGLFHRCVVEESICSGSSASLNQQKPPFDLHGESANGLHRSPLFAMVFQSAQMDRWYPVLTLLSGRSAVIRMA